MAIVIEIISSKAIRLQDSPEKWGHCCDYLAEFVVLWRDMQEEEFGAAG